MLPRVPHSYVQGRRGINKVAAIAANLGQIWRETPTGDVGVDGQIEYVDEAGFATGKTVAVQVKSGEAYFRKQDESCIKFFPEEKHRGYWEMYPLPVIIVLHHPGINLSYWVDVRQRLRSPSADKRAPILIPKSNILETSRAISLFENAGALDCSFIENIDIIINSLIDARSPSASFPLSYFDLFVHGLTNICRDIYFGMDLASSLAGCNQSLNDDFLSFGVGEEEHEFLFGFVKFLVGQDLADINFGNCLINWTDSLMQPRFVAPLTTRGRRVVKAIGEWEDNMVKEGSLHRQGLARVAQEGLLRMEEWTYIDRVPRSMQFQRVFKRRRENRDKED